MTTDLVYRDGHTVGRMVTSRRRRRWSRPRFAPALVALLAGPVPAASAQSPADADVARRVVTVPANAMPWDTRVNTKLDFGMHNGRPPVMVFDPALRVGIKVHFAVAGSTTTVSGGGPIPAQGQDDFVTGAQPEFGWPRFPSRYFAKWERASCLNGLVGAFVDADGRIVGRPFPVGAMAERVVPDGAVALALGLDDDNFADNGGTLVVTLSMPQPKVIVE